MKKPITTLILVLMLNTAAYAKNDDQAQQRVANFEMTS